MTTTVSMESGGVPLMSDYDGGEAGGPAESGIKNDFAYHNNVAGMDKHIRMGFLRKVYGLLAAQLTITTMIAAACLFTPAIKVEQSMYSMYVLSCSKL